MKKKLEEKPVDRLFHLTLEPGTGRYTVHYQSPDVQMHLCFNRDSKEVESLIKAVRTAVSRFPGLGEIVSAAAVIKDKKQEAKAAEKTNCRRARRKKP